MPAVPKVTIIVGGRWHAFDLAKGLKAHGALHRLVTNYPRSKVAGWGLARGEVVTLTSTQWLNQIVQRLVPGVWRSKFQYFIHRRFALDAAKHLDGADIVHGWSSFSEPAIARCRAHDIPFVLERSSSHMRTQCRLLEQECSLLGIHEGITHPEIVAMELREYAAATRIAVPSYFVERSFLENGCPAARLIRNPLGVDLGKFSPGNSRAADGPFQTIYAGALTYRKGIHYLVGAFRQAAMPGARLVLVGGASHETRQLLGAPFPGLVLVGHVPQAELARHYRSAHVFVMASIEDGWGMVLGQALACGLPLICTENTGGEDLLQLLAAGQPAVVENGGVRRYPAGFVVPVRDPGAIARCLRRLHDDSALRQAQRQAALKIHGLPLSWESYASRALSSYVEILSKGPSQ